MSKFHKTLQDKQAPATKNIKTSIGKKRKKGNDEISLNGTHMNTQSKKKKQHKTKNKLEKDIERADDPTKYQKDDKKNSKELQKVEININREIKQKMKNKNKHGAKDTERADVPKGYRKGKKKDNQILQKVHASINKKTKMKNIDKFAVNEKSNISEKYPKDSKNTLEVFQTVLVNTNNKKKRKRRRKKQKQDMNLDHANKNTVTISDTETKNKLQVSTRDLDRKRTKIEKLKKINEKKMKRISVELKTQQDKSGKILKLNECKINIKQLEEMLAKKSQPKVQVAQSTLRDKMKAKLKASRFRFINELLYTNDSSQSKHYFKTDPDEFTAYHEGYKQQVEQWTVNPLDIIISSIKKLPTDNVIADFGCGEARLAASVPHTVHSFDFIALNNRVKVCDMAHTPLLTNSVDVVVFCLSLMGSNLNDYIIEANRVLKNNGILKIAEVESRFENVKDFIRLLRSYGFKNTWKELSHNLFHFMDFKKEKDISMKRKTLPVIILKSCLYKKR